MLNPKPDRNFESLKKPAMGRFLLYYTNPYNYIKMTESEFI